MSREADELLDLMEQADRALYRIKCGESEPQEVDELFRPVRRAYELLHQHMVYNGVRGENQNRIKKRNKKSVITIDISRDCKGISQLRTIYQQEALANLEQFEKDWSQYPRIAGMWRRNRVRL